MRGMPAFEDDRPCKRYDIASDYGSAAGVDELRLIEHTGLIPSVRISRNWALTGWYGGGGGEHLYHRTGGSWRIVTGGGGALGVDGLHEYGVPKRDWCVLAVYDAKCP